MSIIKQDPNNLGKGIRIGMKGLAARASQFQSAPPSIDGTTKPNRITLMLDCSGSMAGQPIEDLKNAVQGFAAACNWQDTSVAIATFPSGDGDDGHSDTPLVSEAAILMLEANRLQAGGGTPMFGCLERVIKNIPLTRGVIVSDGDATDAYGYGLDGSDEGSRNKQLVPYIDSKTPVDTVHIGDSSGGEETLKEIARLTGGIFLKFKDIGQFATAFRYLTPTYRGLLMSPGADRLTGADEIKR